MNWDDEGDDDDGTVEVAKLGLVSSYREVDGRR